MWEAFLSVPRGRISARNFVMFFATLLVASFGYIFSTADTAYAADATWDGDAISYESKTYAGPIKVDGKNGLGNIPKDAQIYQATEKSGTETTAHLIYFTSGNVPKSAKEATYITYTLNPPNYSKPSATKTITFDDSGTDTVVETTEGTSECVIKGVGWMICPISKYIAEGMDYVYRLVDGFLEVRPLDQTEDSAIRRIWSVFRDIANVAFVIAFMMVIYSQITNVGLSSYGLKKLLPRIIIAAILVNISFIICTLAVDLSNILGASINNLFIEIRNSLTGSTHPEMEDINWESMVSFALSGGAVVGAGVVGLSLLNTSIAGALSGLMFIILPILLGVFLVIIVTFLILAARQAIITILIVLAPLAFVAFLLPNTEKWFDKWRDTFFTLLIMYPAFSVVFGGAQLAGQLIIRSATSIEQVVLGLAVQVAPLAITPLLLKLGGGILNRFAGIVNDPGKGLVDRYKNYNKDRLGEHRAKNQATNQERFNNGELGKFRNRMRYGANKNYQKQSARDNMKAQNEARAKALYEDGSGMQVGVTPWTKRNKYDYNDVDALKRDTDLIHQTTEGRHDDHWKKRLNREDPHYDSALASRQMDLINYQESGKESDGVFNTMVGEAKTYQRLLATDSASERQKKIDHNAKLTADGLSEAQVRMATETSQAIAIEGIRLKGAEVVAQGQLAAIYKNNVKVRDTDIQGALDRAAGIDAGGRTKVEARATADLTALHMENVKAVNSIFSNDRYDVPELFNVIQKGVLRGGAPADDMHVHAAIQQVMLEKGNNWSAQKLQDFIGTQAISDTDTEAEKQRKTDMQQIFADSVKSSKLKVGYLSGSDRGRLQTGTYGESSASAIIRDIREEKIKPDRIAGEDIDVLSRMVQVLRDPASQSDLTDENRRVLLESITEAQTNSNLISMSGPREKKMMNVVANYLRDPNYQQSQSQKEAEASKLPPATYTIDDPYEQGQMANEEE